MKLLSLCPGRRPARRSPAGSCPLGGRGRTRRSCRWCRPAPGCWQRTRRRRSRPSAEIDGCRGCALALDAAAARRSPAVVVPVLRSWTKTSSARWCRPAPGCWHRVEGDEAPVRRERRVDAADRCPGRRPARRSPARSCPSVRSRTKTSDAVGVARHQVAGGRVEGDEAPVRRDRHAESPLLPLRLGAARPDADPLGSCPSWRSRTNTSLVPLVSPGTRLVAYEMKATKRPSAEIAGS